MNEILILIYYSKLNLYDARDFIRVYFQNYVCLNIPNLIIVFAGALIAPGFLLLIPRPRETVQSTVFGYCASLKSPSASLCLSVPHVLCISLPLNAHSASHPSLSPSRPAPTVRPYLLSIPLSPAILSITTQRRESTIPHLSRSVHLPAQSTARRAPPSQNAAHPSPLRLSRLPRHLSLTLTVSLAGNLSVPLSQPDSHSQESEQDTNLREESTPFCCLN